MPDGTTELVVQLISSVGIGGVLVWYLYHTTTRTIPDLSKEHTASIKQVTTEFTTALKEQRESHDREIAQLQSAIAGACIYRRDK